MRIMNTWVNANNPKQQTIQIAGSVSRRILPAEFASQNSNPLVSISQGGATNDFKYTILWSYNRELYEQRGGNKATLEDLFPDMELQPHIVRCHIKAWDSKEPVVNPSTGEVVMYNNLPVYQYNTLTIGKQPVIEYTGMEAPSFIKVADVVEKDDIF